KSPYVPSPQAGAQHLSPPRPRQGSMQPSRRPKRRPAGIGGRMALAALRRRSLSRHPNSLKRLQPIVDLLKEARLLDFHDPAPAAVGNPRLGDLFVGIPRLIEDPGQISCVLRLGGF